MINIFKSPESKMFFSFIIGLGISILAFHKPYTSINYLSIPISRIEGKIIKQDEKCYSYVSKDVKCFDEKTIE